MVSVSQRPAAGTLAPGRICASLWLLAVVIVPASPAAVLGSEPIARTRSPAHTRVSSSLTFIPAANPLPRTAACAPLPPFRHASQSLARYPPSLPRRVCSIHNSDRSPRALAVCSVCFLHTHTPGDAVSLRRTVCCALQCRSLSSLALPPPRPLSGPAGLCTKITPSVLTPKPAPAGAVQHSHDAALARYARTRPKTCSSRRPWPWRHRPAPAALKMCVKQC